MKLPRVPIGLVAFLLVSLAAPATGQYMYLDANGDGVHTAADQVNPSGPTVIDVWIDTDSNRDGTAAVCSPNQPPSIRQYVFCLRATAGTISWGTFINRQSSMGTHFGRVERDTEYRDGYGGFPLLPPGTYRLGTLLVAVASGNPSIEIVRSISADFETTSFGAQCNGLDFDGSLKLGSDWLDADGLPLEPMAHPMPRRSWCSQRG